jgi:hypothetical protein
MTPPLLKRCQAAKTIGPLVVVETIHLAGWHGTCRFQVSTSAARHGPESLLRAGDTDGCLRVAGDESLELVDVEARQLAAFNRRGLARAEVMNVDARIG